MKASRTLNDNATLTITIENEEIMKTIKEVIESLKGGKSAYECARICQNAKVAINKEELPKLEEMIEYYGGVHDELDQLNDNFVEVV